MTTHAAPPFSSRRFCLSDLRRLARGRIPGQVVIQYTDRCNASCVQCGMRTGNRFTRSTLRPEFLAPQIEAMAARGVAAISFTGGEPLLCLDDIAALARRARAAGIRYVRTGTNGFFFRDHERPDFAARVAHLADTLLGSGFNAFWISLDSADADLHEANRGLPGVVRGIAKALPIFHAHGLFPAANLGINRHTGGHGAPPPHAPGDPGQSGDPGSSLPFDAAAFQASFRTAFRRFYTFVESLGFTTVNACYPMSAEETPPDGDDVPEDAAITAHEAVYAATSADDFIRFSRQEKAALFAALFEVIPEFRGRLRIFTPRSSLLSLLRRYGGGPQNGHYPCRGGIDFFFMDAARGHIFPCGYRGGEDMGHFSDLNPSAITTKPFCDRCDWECFRDPSEMFGPVMDAFSRPLSLAKRLCTDAMYRRTWIEDMRYALACDGCSAVVAPNPARLARFARPRPSV
ncbi:MAG: radical SAM protein [Desulfovibrionaceae bacterium]|nr:radical SAM protein [Desulfovibrionaceae bacterium]